MSKSSRPLSSELRDAVQRPVWEFLRTGSLIMASTFFHLRVYGKENVPDDSGAVIACNHQSYLDPVVIGLGMPRPIHFMARDTLFRNPLFGAMISGLNAFPVKRGRSDKDALAEAERRLMDGQLVVIFPEGTRTRDGELGRIRYGAIRIARRAGVPIVPVMLDGPYDIMPRHRWLWRPGSISVAVGEPYDPGPDTETKPVQVERLQKRMLALQEYLRSRPHVNKF